jgi:hypothetical protein
MTLYEAMQVPEFWYGLGTIAMGVIMAIIVAAESIYTNRRKG